MSNSIVLKTVDDAWAFFRGRVMDNIRAVDSGTMHIESTSDDDRVLAKFIQDHEGEFEERMIAGLSELAVARWDGSESVSDLDDLLRADLPSENDPPGVRRSPIEAIFRAFNPVLGLRLCWHLVWRHRMEQSRWAAEFFATRLARAPVPPELPPEMCDALGNPRATPLPDVLPMDLEGWSPRDIEVAIEEYIGAPIEQIHARLRAGGGSGPAFLGPDERLGALIWQDAARLRDLGVERDVLAARLARCVLMSEQARVESAKVLWSERREAWCRAPEIEVGLTLEAQWCGSLLRSNPFHTVFGEETLSRFALRNPVLDPAIELRGSALVSQLIRRFCFFEGRFCYGERVEPEIAARVLGLVL
ncbi:hypothetical protein WMF20_48980 [Sorangium sp. So ce834]|uniref:hypothetical protein n=1 Tax=Sorangium sp. So ce834 TaxID=3133321 RepID=UPI003F616F2C